MDTSKPQESELLYLAGGFLQDSKIIQEFYEEDVFITHNKDYHYSMPFPHFHDGYEINFCLTDGVIFRIAGSSYVLKRGAIVVINDQEIHSNASPDNVLYERYVLSFRPRFVYEMSLAYPELLMPFTRRYPGFSHVLKLSEEQVEQLIAQMRDFEELSKKIDVYAIELQKKIKLLNILMFVCEIFATSETKIRIREHHYNPQTKKILAYISDNLAEEITLDTLVSEFYISKSNLIRLFKNETALTPNQYIIMTRIMKSREYLQAGMPVYKVCELVGYKDQSSFIRVFKSTLGITPKKYADNAKLGVF